MRKYFIDELQKRFGYTPADIGIKTEEIELRFLDKEQVNDFLDDIKIREDLNRLDNGQVFTVSQHTYQAYTTNYGSGLEPTPEPYVKHWPINGLSSTNAAKAFDEEFFGKPQEGSDQDVFEEKKDEPKVEPLQKEILINMSDLNEFESQEIEKQKKASELYQRAIEHKLMWGSREKGRTKYIEEFKAQYPNDELPY